MGIRQSQLSEQRNDQRPQSDQQQIAATGRPESPRANQTGDDAAQQNCAISHENQSCAAYDHPLSTPMPACWTTPSPFGRGLGGGPSNGGLKNLHLIHSQP